MDVGAYSLVYWPEESVSVVSDRDIQGESKKVGDECTIAINKKEYHGKIAAKGTCNVHCFILRKNINVSAVVFVILMKFCMYM